ncbi:hypothetical protein SDRG_08010 [Saprolegnia diclina VS20]|uniref:Uncharacterized protein n=1 Tax=Saprolegnia diclina (strain VS20) TaxID=1156394 RepID=T0Q9V4_SAPDV|nr:hypothetical protein SDRG_08010 [Saprolegnia diclina VS20]EQC34694.1 hypothetical protein SDRG_08010 [Saprolegnia diclina VS20]|eukprot:XP_008612100.1 hypothetical protein SDRG_08010 [Saprolegnia diclina VS20]
MLDNTVDAALLCRQGRRATDVTNCLDVLGRARRVARDLAPVALHRPTSVEATSMGFLQIVQRDDELTIESLPLLHDSFAFFGWVALYDWAMNDREALLLEGDVQSYRVLSAKNIRVATPTPVPPTTLGWYLFHLSAITSYTLGLVGCLCCMLAAAHRSLESPWFHFHEVVGAVWLTRNLKLLRALTAVACLASASMGPLQLSASIARLEIAPRALFTSCVLGGETLWLVYVLHDVVLPYTQTVVSRVAPWTNMAAYSIIVARDVLAPVRVSSEIARQCSVIDLDGMVYCNSGTVHVGSTARCVEIGLVLAVSVLLTLLLAARSTHSAPLAAATLPNALLPLAYVAVASPDAVAASINLNAPTAAMCGIFSFRGAVFDIKLWRRLHEPTTLRAHRRRTSFASCLRHAESVDRRQLVVQLLKLLSGLAYVVISIASNIAYVSALSTSMANDFNWATFNSSDALSHLTLTNVEAQDSFFQLPPKTYLGPAPASLLSNTSVELVGGNILCGDDQRPFSPSLGMAIPFGFDSACSWWLIDFFTPSTTAITFALLGYNGCQRLPMSSADVASCCANDIYAEATCTDIYGAIQAFLATYDGAFTRAVDMALDVRRDVDALDIELIQLARAPPLNTTQLLRARLLDPTLEASWTFFGWVYLYEWASAMREVVAFHGDNGSLVLLSSVSPPVSLSLSPSEIPLQLSYVCASIVRYVTMVLLLAAVIVVGYVTVLRGAVEPWNLFEINRVVGHTWVGRLLLVVRSATALWLLNTSRLELARVGVGTVLHAPALSAFKVILASSELTWLVYILNSLGSVYTQQYTRSYAYLSTSTTWLSAMLLALLLPQSYSASMDRQCVYINMDAALDCTSAIVAVGSLRHLLYDVAAALTCVVGSVLVERWRIPKRPPMAMTSLLLDSTSYFMFDFAAWTKPNRECYLDRASAFLAGLVSLHVDQTMYVFDVKNWRLFTYDTPRYGLGRLDRAIALYRIS